MIRVVTPSASLRRAVPSGQRMPIEVDPCDWAEQQQRAPFSDDDYPHQAELRYATF